MQNYLLRIKVTRQNVTSR